MKTDKVAYVSADLGFPTYCSFIKVVNVGQGKNSLFMVPRNAVFLSLGFLINSCRNPRLSRAQTM
jgi:hypothetical protein